jgi:hypothetical protein
MHNNIYYSAGNAHAYAWRHTPGPGHGESKLDSLFWIFNSGLCTSGKVLQGMTSSKVGIHSTFRINLPNKLKLAETEKVRERVYRKVYSVENRLDTNL